MNPWLYWASRFIDWITLGSPNLDVVAVTAYDGARLRMADDESLILARGTALRIARHGRTAFYTEWRGRKGWVSWTDCQTVHKARRMFNEELVRGPDAHAYLSRAAVLQAYGDWSASLSDCDAVLQLEPRNNAANALRGTAALALGRYVEALQAFDTALRHNPFDDVSLTRRGCTLYMMGRNQEAERDYDEAIQLNQHDKTAYEGRAELRMKRGDYDGALADLDEVRRITPTSDWARWMRGLVLIDSGKPDLAVVELTSLIKDRPRYADALAARGLALKALAKSEAAHADFDAALRLNPRTFSALWGRAVQFESESRNADALAAYTQLIELWPEEPTGYEARAGRHFEEQRWGEAVHDCNEALRLTPYSVDTLSIRSAAYRGLGQTAESAADFERARQLAPASAEPYIRRGMFGWYIGEFAAAIEDFDIAISLGSKELGGIRQLRVICRLHLGDVDAAIVALKEILEASGSRPAARAMAHRLMGSICSAGDEAAEAHYHFEQAMTLGHRRDRTCVALAHFLATCPDAAWRNGAEAVKLARQGLALAGNEPLIWVYHWVLAAALAEIGDYQAAVAEQHAAMDIAPEFTQTYQRDRLNLYRAGRPNRERAFLVDPEHQRFVKLHRPGLPERL